MATTVTSAFEEFRERIELSSTYREVATARRNRIVELLEDHFEIVEAFPTGSVPRYTALSERADLDVMVALHYSKHAKGKLPSQVLSDVQSSLSGYPRSVRRNGQAVTLRFDSWPNVDIVPVYRTTTGDEVSHYNVPDMNREVWLWSNPKQHDAEMTQRNATASNFKRLIKMIKWWNLQHSALLQSYHIEVLCLRLVRETSNYPWDLYCFFREAYETTASPLLHHGYQVDSYFDSNVREEVRKRLSTARDHSYNAWYQGYKDRPDHEEAIRIWQIVFGDRFPAYG